MSHITLTEISCESLVVHLQEVQDYQQQLPHHLHQLLDSVPVMRILLVVQVRMHVGVQEESVHHCVDDDEVFFRSLVVFLLVRE